MMNKSGAPADLWGYALKHAAHVINRLAKKSLGWRTPWERREGETPDISHLRWPFYQMIMYLDPESKFPDC